MMRKILVVGGAGLVGDAVVRDLLAGQFNLDPVVVDRREPLAKLPGVEYVINPDFDVFRVGDLADLVERYQPKAVIDSVNIASIASRQDRISEFVEEYCQRVIKPIIEQGICWLNVGTVATGGMGYNIPFTHNEPTEDGNAAPGLVKKLRAASVHTGQLRFFGRTLCHKVGEVLPEAMIGFEPPFYGPVDVAHIKDGAKEVMGMFMLLSKLRDMTFNVAGPYRNVAVRAGENGHFARAELEAITAPGMMEVVTAQAVSAAVMEVLGILLNNIGGTYFCRDIAGDITSHCARRRVLDQMAAMAREHSVDSVILGNLGPFMTTEMLALWIMQRAGITIQQLADKTFSGALEPFGKLRDLIVWRIPGLGIPVITDTQFCPAYEGLNKVAQLDVEKQVQRVGMKGDGRLWAVDLRTLALDRWVNVAQQIIAANANPPERSVLPLDPDGIIDPGNFWAAKMALTGHGRAAYARGYQVF